MKVALIGASGHAGSRILAELSRRGHTVTAIARHPATAPEPLPGVTWTTADANQPQALAEVLRGDDAVISALRFLDSDPQKLLEAVRLAGVKRYLVVGGAATLQVKPGLTVLDSPGLPEAYRPEATAGARFLEVLKGVSDLDWTFLSPSAEFSPGQRTGVFRLGDDELLVGPDGSRISFEDYAVALVDELEHPKHLRRRFTVGY
jgi:hypothetical protein